MSRPTGGQARDEETMMLGRVGDLLLSLDGCDSALRAVAAMSAAMIIIARRLPVMVRVAVAAHLHVVADGLDDTNGTARVISQQWSLSSLREAGARLH